MQKNFYQINIPQRRKPINLILGEFNLEIKRKVEKILRNSFKLNRYVLTQNL